jgi:hypothetical protein
MNCANCGTKLLDDAQFCHKCGRSLGSAKVTQSPANNPSFEFCKLNRYIIKGIGVFGLLNPFAQETWRWFAEVIGPTGKYTIAQSSEFKASLQADIAPTFGQKVARDEIVAKLLSEGWEPIDTKHEDQSFRRRIS